MAITTYTLRKRKGQKRMTLSVHENGRVTVTVPRFVSKRVAHQFVEERHAWIEEALAHLGAPKEDDRRAVRADFEAHREDARTFVRARLTALNCAYGFSYKKIRICANTSRWGSASSTGTLSFDYRVLFLPPALQDYLLVHELCHLQEMNHGPRFWALVAQTIPDHRVRRSALRVLERGKLRNPQSHISPT